MRIMIAGGTGFVGRRLIDHFRNPENMIYVLTRQPEKHKDEPYVKYIEWLTPDSQPEIPIQHVDVCINLAGESLNSGRWTEERKRSILESRMTTTREFIRVMDALKEKPEVYINASAIGYYGTSTEKIFTENTMVAGRDFLAEVCDVWEAEAQAAETIGVRTVLARFGLILDRNNGVLPLFALPYQMMIGGKIGSGEQWMSWIHIQDVVCAIDWIIHQEELSGPVNFTAPKPKRNKDFGKKLAETLNRPTWLSIPSSPVRVALGDMSDLILKGQYVLPRKLQDSGYSFKYRSLDRALDNIYK
ncbi:TIGR01777 family protein [Allobacillus sp. SKP2-8]|nr:TIGR01777 family oxidoreductase [Allobacillus sp. SKP2-8]TSJ66947.1 TIGR01777 family protein [Allobacillus sp. SKP2-8]